MNVQNFATPFGLDNTMDLGPGLQTPNAEGTGQVFTGSNWGDKIRTWQPQSGTFDSPNSTPFSFGGMMSRLMSMLSQLLSALGVGGASANGSQSQTPFTNAQGSSTGDPHLSFNGTTTDGASNSAHYDSMNAHGDLLDSNSFAGGYRLSTMTGTPNAQGVTWNRKATVTTGYGATKVSLDSGGNARVSQNGTTTQLQSGQSLNLGNGESIDYGADGSLVISDTNAAGGTIATTLRKNGQGVDVSVSATNVDLGGDLVNHL